MANNEIYWCHTRTGSRDGNLHQALITYILQNIFQMVSDAFIMGKPEHLGLKKATNVV